MTDATAGIWRWADRIDPHGAVPTEARITMGEGPAPMVRSTRIGPRAGFELWLLFLALPMVAWARLRLRSHSPAQVAVGAVLGGLMSAVIFGRFVG